MNIRIKFGSRLKHLRKFRKMSQDAVSLASGVDRSYLSEIENGKVSPTIDVIDRIAQALDVAPKELLEESVAEPEVSYSGKKLKA
ncbi:MAG TPA: helix-turn-helix transcriptional regulator [bacterium]|nr:helix-turn-helix transcriptional regulator [bacterium]